VLGIKQYINQEKNTNYTLRFRCIIFEKYAENMSNYQHNENLSRVVLF